MRLLDSEEAAVACGESPEKVREAVRDGRLTNYGRPRRYRLRIEEVLLVFGDPRRILG